MPIYLMLSALLIGVSEVVEKPLIVTAPAILMAGVFALLAVEILRRYVLTSRRSGGGKKAVAALRVVVWTMVAGALPFVVFLAVGVLTACYENDCGDFTAYSLSWCRFGPSSPFL